MNIQFKPKVFNSLTERTNSMDEPEQTLPDESGSAPTSASPAPPNLSASTDTRKPPLSNCMPAPNLDASKDEHFFAWSVFNRDLSQLEFYKRVLEEASDESVPLLERLKFLAVFASNLDEFFMVRVSGLKEMLEIEDFQPMPGELTPIEQLKAIRERVLPLVEDQVKCLQDSVLPELAKQGLAIVSYDSLTEREQKHLESVFHAEHFSRVDAPRGRSGPSVSLHRKSQSEYRANGWRRVERE